MLETSTTRANPGIDPLLHAWHGEVALYLFLGGVAAGIMILTGLRRLRHPDEEASPALRWLPWTSLLLISAGMLCLFLDLANRWNAWRFYLILRPQTPMSWGAWILLLVYPVAAHFAWAGLPAARREQWRRFLPGRWLRGLADWSLRARPLFARLSILTGVLLGLYTGILLAASSARPLWNSALLGPLFLVSGLSTGAAFLLLFRLAEGERQWLGRADLGLIGGEIGLLALWMIGLAVGGEAGRQALALILGGPWTAAFWTLVVATGLLAPLAAALIERRHGLPPGRATALLVLAGGFSLRWILVFAGQESRWVEQVTALLK
ncbi:MAG: NrfD/PsrC family molybdoenzyme membrane anchor subunit [bacterium]|nr:NrfD/PsrC family molybdoenzyme membrane anchor subunit [bacterium]